MAINYFPTRGALDDRENEAFVLIDDRFYKAALVRPDPAGPSFPVSLVDPSNQVVLNIFNSVTALASGSETIVTTYTVPSGKRAFLQLAQVTGNNVCIFRVKSNSTVIAVDRLWWTKSVSSQIDFISSSRLGPVSVAGDVIDITVEHSRPYVGDFEARMIIVEETL